MASSTRYWRVFAGANQPVTVTMASGTGDADLYTRFGSGDHYIMMRGYKAYSGVSLVVTY